MILQIGTTDISNYVSELKADRNTLVADTSGRNAAGTMAIDVIANKWKISVKFRPLNNTELATLYGLISSYSGLTVKFMNPFTGSLQQMTAYTSTPSIE